MLLEKDYKEPERYGLTLRTASFRKKMRENTDRRFSEYYGYRAVCRVKSFEATKDEIHPLKRGAKAAKHILENIPVGFENEDLFATYVLPAVSKDEIDNAYKYLSGHPTWGGNHWHMALNYEKLLGKGIRKILRDIDEKVAELSGRDDNEAVEKLIFYEACRTSLEAVSTYARRYRDEAERLMLHETEPGRREELSRIVKALGKVPDGPAESFFEAMQSLQIYHFAEQIVEENYTSTGRLDFIMDEFYHRDIENGTVTPAESAEWIQLFLMRSCLMVGHGDSVILGGSRPDGTPLWNDLSYFVLDAARLLNLHGPQLSVRYAQGIPRSLIGRGFEVISANVPQPSFYNDKVVIPAMVHAGFTVEHARDYVHCQCVELTSAGRSDVLSAHTYHNLAKSLERLINGGREIIEETRSTAWELKEFPEDVPTKFNTFEELKQALRDYLSRLIEATIHASNRRLSFKPEAIFTVCAPLIEGCIEKGASAFHGGALYNQTFPNFTGLVTTGDSLSAIKKAVFEDKKLTLEELTELCRKNFEGAEDIRQYLLNKCPKYGNGDPEADSMVKWVFDIVADELDKYKNIYGEKFGPCYFGFTEIEWQAHSLAATPDGRKHGESPSSTLGGDIGRDRNGLTALFASATSMDHSRVSGGLAANIKVSPTFLRTDEDLEKMVDALLVYFENGGMQAQFNCVNAETLREAQRCPEMHGNLIVRVSGFSTYFLNLGKATQEQIIERIAHEV